MRLRQVAQRADDLDRAAAFYTRLLGVEPTARFDPPGLLFFDLDGVRLMLERGAERSTIYLDVDNVDAVVERMRPHAEITGEPHVIYRHQDDTLGPAGTEEVQAFLLDSEGNTIGLVGFRRAE